MNKTSFILFFLYSLFVASPLSAAAESQTWKVRPGDNLDVIATTLEIPKEEIKKHNPGVLESNLQIDQKLKLPLHSYVESKTLQEELSKKDERIGTLERKNGDLEKQIASAESQLRLHPIWLWGFWICFGIIAFIVSGAYWIFRQTHPRVFEQPHDYVFSLGHTRRNRQACTRWLCSDRDWPRADADSPHQHSSDEYFGQSCAKHRCDVVRRWLGYRPTLAFLGCSHRGRFARSRDVSLHCKRGS